MVLWALLTLLEFIDFVLYGGKMLSFSLMSVKIKISLFPHPSSLSPEFFPQIFGKKVSLILSSPAQGLVGIFLTSCKIK